MKTKGWSNTDPDNFQFCQRIADKTYNFREFNHTLFHDAIADTMQYINDKDKMTPEAFVDKYWDDDSLWVEEQVNIEDYTAEEIQEILDGYGYEYDGECVTFPTGEYYVANDIIAECIFEYETQY